ncbi:uncharacterized protein STEHIDRAFT_163486 [Stereum hirsutum FP-91666 SS1]|uniref:Uncharacterized protein n=1 Tax=Stereum hirsutum (strain FP-91666) TaxID=721885 RepID=R7RZC0_STEHR|nr:uncharacterized protein STEHIDRAFT_163486 [Stereum hirsutum FP-91666 SS1]EIM79662.1 hypothetical protein STEHIDRAFT_163486 [Stereum hirsutum FP-91666 SS1]
MHRTISGIVQSSILSGRVDALLLEFSDLHDPGRLRDVQGCRLTRVQHWKKRTGQQHEYLIFDLVTAEGDTRQVITQRFWGTDNPRTRSPINSSNGLADASGRSSLALGSKAARFDEYKVVFDAAEEVDTAHATLIFTYTFPADNRPDIIQLAVLANCVSDAGPRYHLYSTMCYWFARILYETAFHLFPGGQEIRGEKWYYRGRFKTYRFVNDECRFCYGELAPGGRLAKLLLTSSDTNNIAQTTEVTTCAQNEQEDNINLSAEPPQKALNKKLIPPASDRVAPGPVLHIIELYRSKYSEFMQTVSITALLVEPLHCRIRDGASLA